MPAAQRPMDHAEMTAKLVLEAALPGARLEYCPEQSHGEYDFDLHYPNGTVAAVEVTESTVQNQKWMSDKISKEKGGSIIESKYCKKSWIIFVMDAKAIADIRKTADKCLAKVEQAGIDGFKYLDAQTARLQREAGLEKVLDPPLPRCVEDFCCDFKIQFGSVVREETPPKIYIRSPVRGGAVGPSAAIEAGEREAWKEDNRRKLGAAKTEERHLFVYIDPMNGLPRIALTDFEPPSVLPNIPEEITHIWLVGHSGEANEFVIWRATAKEHWANHRVGRSPAPATRASAPLPPAI